MRPYSLTALRAALGNVDTATRKNARMPGHQFSPPISERDYLGWRDPSAPQRGYIFVDSENGPIGIMVTKTRASTSAQRAVMCEFCRIPRRFEQVVLFVAPVAEQRDSSTFGTYLCVDLDCNARINALRPLTPLDPPAEALVAARREDLARRSRSFVTEVLERVSLR